MSTKLITELRQSYVDILAKHKKLYHFDDDASDIHTVVDKGMTEEKTFTYHEAAIVNRITEALHSEEMFDMAIKKIE